MKHKISAVTCPVSGLADMKDTLTYICNILKSSGSEAIDRAQMSFPESIVFPLFDILVAVDKELMARTNTFNDWSTPSSFPLSALRDALRLKVRESLEAVNKKLSIQADLETIVTFLDSETATALKALTSKISAASLDAKSSGLIRDTLKQLGDK